MVGFLVSKLRRALFGGELTTVNYLAHIRVHPARQRRGIGSRLIRAHLAYGDEAGANVHWGAVEAGNAPSLGNFHKAGFVDARPIRALGFPLTGLTRLEAAPGLAFRVAGPGDADEAATLLDRFYSDYPKLFLHFFAAADRPAAVALVGGIAREWQWRTRDLGEDRRPVVLAGQDEGGLFDARTGALGAVAFLLGRAPYCSHVHVLVKTDRPFDLARPWWLNFWT